MKKDVFNVWFRELCTLILTQTVQAFVLAIILSMMAHLLTQTTYRVEEGETVSLNSTVTSSGVICIIALFSLNKIELLVKKIFGVTSSFGDPSMAAGKSSLLGSWIALRGIGRTMNNIPKIASGGVGWVKNRGRLNRAQKAYNQEKKLDKARNRLNRATPPSNVSQLNDADSNISLGTSSNSASQDVNAQLYTILNQMQAANNKGDNKDKLRDAKKQLDDAKKARNESRAKMIKGLGETAGSIVGGTAGAIVGLAQGEDVAKNIGIGAGAGDIVGEVAGSAVSGVRNAPSQLEMFVSNERLEKKQAKKAKAEYDKKIKDLETEIKQIKTEKKSNSSSEGNASNLRNRLKK